MIKLSDLKRISQERGLRVAVNPGDDVESSKREITTAATSFDNNEESLITQRHVHHGRPVRVDVLVSVREPNAVKRVTFLLKDNGTIIKEFLGKTAVTAGTDLGEPNYFFVVFTPANGIHTYELTAANASDTNGCSADDREITIMEFPLNTIIT